MTVNRPPSLPGFGKARRKSVSVSDESLVKTRPLLADRALPLLVEPAMPGLDLSSWATGHRSQVEDLLIKHRALLFRGFGIDSVESFNAFIHATSGGKLLEYRDRSSPRHAVGENIYTSTDHPADQEIFLHNEGTYWTSWPLRIYFSCLILPERGGATPIADCRRIYERIPEDVRRRFAEKKVLYVRNYTDGFGLPWQTAFQTDDRAVVEEYCREKDIELEWKGGDRLRTRQVRQAAATHPLTGEKVWFNHATFFHVTTLPEAIRDTLLAEFAEEDLPYNTYYGDGSPIEGEVLDQLRALYREEKVAYPWQKGDVLMLDNMAIAHGREPFGGERKVVVGMADPHVPGDDSHEEGQHVQEGRATT